MKPTFKKATPRFKLALLLSAEPDGSTYGNSNDRPSGRIEARAYAIDTTQRKNDDTEEGDFECISFVYDQANIRDLRDFRYHGWFYRDTLQAYGNEPQFEGGSYVDLDDAQRFYRILKRLDAALDKIRAIRGYAADVTDDLGRVCEALKVDFLVVKRSPEARELCGYKYRAMTVGDGINWLRSRLHDLKVVADVPAQA